MSSYIGRHAKLYDLFYGDKPYKDEAAFVGSCLKRYGDGGGGRLLELACGTGTHALELEKLGFSVVAVDYSKDMLKCAEGKKAKASSGVDFRFGDMRELDIDDEPFDTVVSLFDSIGYVETDEGIAKVLGGVYRHLKPGGLFIFEFWHAEAMLKGYDPVRVKRWDTNAGEVVRISETTLVPERGLGMVDYTIFEPSLDGGGYTKIEERQTNRYFTVDEMAGLVKSSGLEPVKWFSGFSDNEDITDETWHVVAVARRI